MKTKWDLEREVRVTLGLLTGLWKNRGVGCIYIHPKPLSDPEML